MTSAFQRGRGNNRAGRPEAAFLWAGSLTINGKLLPFTCFQRGLDREYDYRPGWLKGIHIEAIDTQGKLV